MKNVTLDLRCIETKAALHIYLQYMLDLPPHYGCNLDALHDCLTEMSDEMNITVLTQGVHGELAAYTPKMMRAMQDAAEDNPRLAVQEG